MARRWADVAELIATQGLKGRFVARSVRGLPFLLHEGMRVSFVPPTLDGPRHVRVKSVQHTGQGDYLVEFKGVKGRDDAELVVGSHCLVSCDELPDGFDGMGAAATDRLVGYEVFDAIAGHIGTVVDITPMPTQDLLVIKRAEGEGEALVPFVDEFLVECDDAARELHLDLPSGLLDLA